ncbi:hypothetical protein PGTUg99_034234 [Puccinia graminis f. sp. tritici]|uniref:Uncharacterized protein n=1 Tax=Puccinia graminis f. sp. tritici TaxID=56615 RepID=A0A5B0P5N4_PUCGR|nr:hypothetical protein PGTUg99_034234 [Puccinia graminis f. sp. tritici]
MHQRKITEREAASRSVGTEPARLPPKGLAVEQLVEEHRDACVFDTIGLDQPASPMEVQQDPLEGVNPSDYTMFDDTDECPRPDSDHFDWDDYLFEAINQLTDEQVPREIFNNHRATSAESSWYPFKNREVRTLA